MLKAISVSALIAALATMVRGEGEPRLLEPHTTGARMMLYRPGLLTYDNYGLEGYRTWPRNVITRTANPVYDEFGDFLVNGVEVYHLRENRRFDDPAQVFSGSTIAKPNNYEGFLNRLMVADDSYNSWQTRLIIGDRIRTHFSPLILDLAALNGIRWDLANERHNFSVLASRMDKPVLSPEDATALSTAAFAAYLLGGHWQWRWRTIDLSTSYVNLFRIDTRSPPDWNGMKGQLPNRVQVIDYLVVRIEDTSPLDGDGARVFDVNILLNGERRDDIESFVTRHNTEDFNPSFPNKDFFFKRPIPPYVEVLQGRRLGTYPLQTPEPGGFFRADGKNYVLFWFPLPEDEEVVSASFEALLSGNYRVSVSEIYAVDPRESRNEPAQRNRATFYKSLAGSKGRGSAGADVEQVRFDYGRQTGLTLTGLGLSTDVKGFHFKGEWAHSFNFLQYPVHDHRGQRHDRRGHAYLLNIEREFTPKIAVGGELFRLGPEYRTQLSVTDLTLGAYAASGTGPFAGALGSTDESLNNTLDLNTVDDNDDKDPFPDDFFIPSFEDQNGVFPGLDKDQDGTPDTNRNRNQVPDYFEPFLLYDVNPDDFDYGDDLNNNGVIDVRENDNKPDYPYDLNRKGYHLFVRFQPQRALELTFGRYDMEAIWGGQRADVWYAKAEYQRRFGSWGELRAVDFLKRVRDDIPDGVFRFGDVANFDIFNPRATIETFVEDELLLQDSAVNTAFVDFAFRGVRNLFVGANLKFEVNQQLSAKSDDNAIQLWTSVLRADYRWRLGGLEVSPRYKLMLRRRTDDGGRIQPRSEVFGFPMIVADFKFTERTFLRGGFQGLSALPSIYRNGQNEDQDYNTRDALFMLVNRFEYAGFDMALTAGYEISRRRMKDRTRKFEDINFEQFFIRMVVGLEPVQ